MSRMITNGSLRDCTTAVDNAANIFNGCPSHIDLKSQVKIRTTNAVITPETDFLPSQRPMTSAATPLSVLKASKKSPSSPKNTELKSLTVSRHDPYSLSLLHSPCTPMDGFLASYLEPGLSNAPNSSVSSLVCGTNASPTPFSDLQGASLPSSLPTLYDTSLLPNAGSYCDMWRPVSISPTYTPVETPASTQGAAGSVTGSAATTDITPSGHHHYHVKANSFPNAAAATSLMSISLASSAFNELQRNPKPQHFGSCSTSTIVGYTVDRSKGRPIPVRKAT